MLQRVRFDGSFLAILFAFTFTVLGLGGCGSGMSTPPPTLVSLQVTPANPSVAEGSQQQFTATGTFRDGRTPHQFHSPHHRGGSWNGNTALCLRDQSQ